ncbi:MAG: AAA family ATPase [Nanoarchaeota archaeon]
MDNNFLLDQFFDEYLKKSSIFKNREALSDSYIPEKIHHREKEIKKIASVLAPALKLERISNLFIYGKTGTGKTLTVTYVLKHFAEKIKQMNLPIKIVQINARLKNLADTEYKLVSHIIKEIKQKQTAITGISLEELYDKFFETIKPYKHLILVIDEIDAVINKSGDSFLYNFLRSHYQTETKISIIGISNDIFLMEKFDPRVKSSLFHEELIFEPYNAIQLIDILKERAKAAFNEGVIEEGVIEKIAAISAQEHGDARRAINLLRLSGEIAEREESDKITLEHVDKAIEELEKNETIETIKSLPRQHQIILYSIISFLSKHKDKVAYTGVLYNFYENFVQNHSLAKPVTPRRFSEILSELDLMGLIKAEINYLSGRGKTRFISLPLKQDVQEEIMKILKEEIF